MKKSIVILLVFPIFLLTCSLVYAAPKILDLSNGNIISFSQMIDDLRKADIVFLGDDVTADAHRVCRLEIIKAFHEKDRNLAVGVEVFRNENQYILDQWTGGEISKKRFVDAFDKNWGDWNRYRKFFEYMRDNKIKLIGLNISRDILIQVQMKGFDSLSPEQLGGLEGITCTIQPGYQEVMRRVKLYRGMLKAQAFNNFCETKILGDIAMARNLEKFHKENPDLIKIVIAGNAHAWKHGIPSHLNNPIKVATKTVLFEAEGRITRDTVTAAEADYLWLDYGPPGLHPGE